MRIVAVRASGVGKKSILLIPTLESVKVVGRQGHHGELLLTLIIDTAFYDKSQHEDVVQSSQ
jgi:hypothetical protein